MYINIFSLFCRLHRDPCENEIRSHIAQESHDSGSCYTASSVNFAMVASQPRVQGVHAAVGFIRVVQGSNRPIQVEMLGTATKFAPSHGKA